MSYVAPKRRWLRFSLRTLFVVVTVVALWLGWQVNTVQQRKAMRNWIEEGGGQVSVFYPPQPFGPLGLIIVTGEQPEGQDFQVPVIRRWLGDEPVWRVEVRSDASSDQIAQARRLFPEAEVLNVHSKPQPGQGYF